MSDDLVPMTGPWQYDTAGEWKRAKRAWLERMLGGDPRGSQRRGFVIRHRTEADDLEKRALQVQSKIIASRLRQRIREGQALLASQKRDR